MRARLSIATASIPVSTPISSSPLPAKPKLSASFHTSALSRQAASTLHSAAYTASELTIWGMTLKIMREEGGIRGLYRGLAATAFGVAPYVGINFASYEFLRGIITPPGKSSVVRKLTCGALAGAFLNCSSRPASAPDADIHF